MSKTGRKAGGRRVPGRLTTEVGQGAKEVAQVLRRHDVKGAYAGHFDLLQRKYQARTLEKRFYEAVSRSRRRGFLSGAEP